MTIGEKFKAIRKIKGLTLAAVADSLKLKSTGHLSQIERGEKEPSPALINHFKMIFSVSENWWETSEGEMFLEVEDSRRHTVPMVEEQAEEYRRSITLDGRELSRQEEKILKMYRYLEENNPELAQHAYEIISEEFMMAAIEKGKG